MEDLRTILSSHNSKKKGTDSEVNIGDKKYVASVSEIPDIFFDKVLIRYKLNRVDILVLMYLYRVTWCRANLHQKYGITPMISHRDLVELLEIDLETFHQAINRLEGFGFVEVIRSGQYFVRKYFTEEDDRRFGQNYDSFL